MRAPRSRDRIAWGSAMALAAPPVEPLRDSIRAINIIIIIIIMMLMIIILVIMISNY